MIKLTQTLVIVVMHVVLSWLAWAGYNKFCIAIGLPADESFPSWLIVSLLISHSISTWRILEFTSEKGSE